MVIRRRTEPTMRVLETLLERPDDDHWGLDIARRAGLLPATVYPITARLEEAGWLTSVVEDVDPRLEGRRPRRLYRLTPEGARLAGAELREWHRRSAALRHRPALGFWSPG